MPLLLCHSLTDAARLLMHHVLFAAVLVAVLLRSYFCNCRVWCHCSWPCPCRIRATAMQKAMIPSSSLLRQIPCFSAECDTPELSTCREGLLGVVLLHPNGSATSFKCIFYLNLFINVAWVSVSIVMGSSSLTTNIFIYCHECLILL